MIPLLVYISNTELSEWFDAAYNIQLSTNKEYIDIIIATGSMAAYKHPAFSSLRIYKNSN